MGGRPRTVFKHTTQWPRQRGFFALLLLLPLDVLLSRRPWVAWRSDLERPRCCFLGGVGASISEAMVAWTLSSCVFNSVFRAGGLDTAEDKFVLLTPRKLFDACFRALSLADANE